MRTLVFSIFAFAVLLLVGCGDFLGTPSDQALQKTYVYTAYDSTGAAIVEGELELRFKEAKGDDHRFQLRGHWDLQKIDTTKRPIGEQTGDGELRGTVSEKGGVWINLNPNVYDDNVTLRGEFVGQHLDRLEGKWLYASLVPINGGSFEATAK